MPKVISVTLQDIRLKKVIIKYNEGTINDVLMFYDILLDNGNVYSSNNMSILSMIDPVNLEKVNNVLQTKLQEIKQIETGGE